MITIPLLEIKDNKIINSTKEIKFGKKYYPEFKGYVFEEKKENKLGIWISVIEAKDIGKGHFSKLIRDYKEKYDYIKIPAPSKMMIDRAFHLVFKIKTDFFPEPFNEYEDILIWEKEETK
jgi:hypothetical protein